MHHFELDGIKIIDYISRMTPETVRDSNQEYMLVKLAEDMKKEIIKRKIEVLWKK